MKTEINLLSVGVIAFNEEKYLPTLLENLYAQDYPKEKIEVVLIDSDSTDNTKQIMQEFAHKNQPCYASIRVLDNPKKTQPAGWNVFFKNFTGDVAIRIDAHAQLDLDFLKNIEKAISQGEYVVGGQRPCTVTDDATDWQQVLLVAEESLFGSSIAGYRGENSEKQYVKSIFHGAYRREVVNAVGSFDERLIRTEDNDIHYRIRKAGYQICLDPSIKSWQIIRPSLKAMVKQKYANGYWIGKTVFIQPKCLGLHHFVPAVFVSALGVGGILALFKRALPLKLLLGSYALADLLMSITAVRGQVKNPKIFALPLIFPLLHISYGVGTIKGLLLGIIEALKKK